MIQRFLGALQFLTIVPIRGQTAPVGQCAVFFPLVGALLGASAGAVLLLATWIFPKPLSSLLAVVWLIAITGCLHEDGLADVADAIRSGRSREKMMLILKDSRIGTYGGVALAVSILLRWQALSICSVNALGGLAETLALSRTALVVLAATTPVVGDGLAKTFAAGLSRPIVICAIVQAILFSFITGWRYAFALSLATAIVIGISRWQFLRHLGGVNGDCLGATCQAVETVNLLVLACRLSF